MWSVLKRYRVIVVILADAFLVTMSYVTAWLILMRRINLQGYISQIMFGACIFVVSHVGVYAIYGMYKSLWKYVEVYEFFKNVMASATAASIYVITTFFWRFGPNPITVYFVSILLATISTLYIRLFYWVFLNRRTLVSRRVPVAAGVQRVLLVGCGSVGCSVIIESISNPKSRYHIIVAVDDDSTKHGRNVRGVKIEGNRYDIPALCSKYKITTIIFAIPNADESDKTAILDICSRTSCALKIIPNIGQILDQDTNMMPLLRDVQVEDLLGRDTIKVESSVSEFLRNKVVMVTGGGGSIGSELCRQIASARPKRLIILDIYENNAYDIQQELVRTYGDNLQLDTIIASVRDDEKLDKVFETLKPQIVFHAAAHKHVPLMERCPEEAIKNNVFGTLNVCRAAVAHGAKKFILISTDKAVNPTNAMGASKRVCEMVIQAFSSSQKNTEFAAVRFGNVLGSNGSVIPLFKQQIMNGGPVTVTDPNIIRYFMTISEAVSLVLKAAELAKGGEIFILDMGRQVRILDLAEKLIRLSGFVPYDEIPIEFSGLRPGEKLYEELLLNEEGIQKTANNKIYVAKPTVIELEDLTVKLNELNEVMKTNDRSKVMKALSQVVETYTIDKR